MRLTATGTFSDGTTEDLTDQASWISNPGNIAQVQNGLNGGMVKGLSVGSASITATLDGVHGSTTVTVTARTLKQIQIAFKVGSGQTVNQGGTKQLSAIGVFSNGSFQNITAWASWTSSNTAIATVGSSGNQNGLVSGVAVGTAKITAAGQGGITGSATVTVVLPP